MGLFSSNLKNFQEVETLKKLLIFQEMKLFSPSRENFLYFRKQKPEKMYYIFSTESFSYISGKETSKRKL